MHFKDDVQWYENVRKEFHCSLDMVQGYIEEGTFYLFLKSNIIVPLYRTVVGFSGIMLYAMFYGINNIVPEFEEYTEQYGSYPHVRFISVNYGVNDITTALKAVLSAGNYSRNDIYPSEAFRDFVKEFQERIFMGESY